MKKLLPAICILLRLAAQGQENDTLIWYDDNSHVFVKKADKDTIYSLGEFVHFYNVVNIDIPLASDQSRAISNANYRGSFQNEPFKYAWWFNCVSIDTSRQIEMLFCGSDSVMKIKARIRIDLEIPATGKHQELFFTAYIPPGDPVKYVSKWNSYNQTWNNSQEAWNNPGSDNRFYLDVHYETWYEVYVVTMRYTPFDYRCDVTSPEMYFYFR